MELAIKNLEYLRAQADQKFQQVQQTMIECGEWALPHRVKWLKSQTEGERNNRHIVDTTHILALRSYVAGFLEGNTSAGRPWIRYGHADEDRARFPANKAWLEKFTRRILYYLGQSNFYHEAGAFYYDMGVFNTGAHWIQEIPGGFHFHTLIPGSYKVLNDEFGVANIMIRQIDMDVKAFADFYVKKGDWSNVSWRVKNAYEQGNYTTKIGVVHVMMPNKYFNPNDPQVGTNKPWISVHYEAGSQRGTTYANLVEEMGFNQDKDGNDVFLLIEGSRRKPFICGRSESNGFEYGLKGPTLDALGLIKSLNKKAIGKDQALEKMLSPTTQGPASIKKSYRTLQPNQFIPLDATAAAQGGIKPVNQVNAAIAPLLEDVSDLRQQVDKHYYADFLLYLSKNPKTRTATETNAILAEQQLVIGPNLQSLNTTYNIPIVEFVADWVLYEDPDLEPAPDTLQGEFLKLDFISVFAQAQKAADLPAIDRYVQMIQSFAQFPQGAAIFDKLNLDKLADLYEDRFFLPSGLNRPQDEVDAQRQQAQAMAERNNMIQNQLPAIAGAAKDLQTPQQ